MLPELYLILAVLYYWTLTSSMINPIAIVLIALLFYQLINRKKILGLILAILLVLLNAYMILALISELSEFQEFNHKAQKLTIVGFLYFGFNIIFGTSMFLKYIKK